MTSDEQIRSDVEHWTAVYTEATGEPPAAMILPGAVKSEPFDAERMIAAAIAARDAD